MLVPKHKVRLVRQNHTSLTLSLLCNGAPWYHKANGVFGCIFPRVRLLLGWIRYCLGSCRPHSPPDGPRGSSGIRRSFLRRTEDFPAAPATSSDFIEEVSAVCGKVSEEQCHLSWLAAGVGSGSWRGEPPGQPNFLEKTLRILT